MPEIIITTEQAQTVLIKVLFRKGLITQEQLIRGLKIIENNNKLLKSENQQANKGG